MRQLKIYTETVEHLQLTKGGNNMPIYFEFIERVEDGETFYVDFEKRTMKVGNDFLIKNGEYDKSRELLGIDIYPSIHVVLHMIRELYAGYKYSLPSERSENKRKKYFKALPIEELTDEQLIRAERREYRQAVLEGFVLCTILTGQLYWDEEKMGKWFWESRSDKDLIILRKWIERKGE